jgi:hypothetical protein
MQLVLLEPSQSSTVKLVQCVFQRLRELSANEKERKSEGVAGSGGRGQDAF